MNTRRLSTIDSTGRSNTDEDDRLRIKFLGFTRVKIGEDEVSSRRLSTSILSIMTSMNKLRMSLKILMYKLALALSLPMSDWASSARGEAFSDETEVDPLTEVAAFPSLAAPRRRSKSDLPSTGVASEYGLMEERPAPCTWLMDEKQITRVAAMAAQLVRDPDILFGGGER